MGKFSSLLVLWMLVVAVQSEANSAAQMRSDSLHIVHTEKSFTSSGNDAFMYIHLLRSMREAANTYSETDVSTAQPVHIYRHAFHGFSARLTTEEAEALQNMEGVLGVYRDRVRHVQTTHTPAFLGLSDTQGLWPQSGYGEDVIVGVLDTGVWPESGSFSDEGLGPVPARWKGICQTGKDFHVSNCNKKLIGARWYSKGIEQILGRLNETVFSRSPRDTEGHGSHTSSTAAGAAVANASLLGFAAGTARGMATKARIAMYKICWATMCMESDIAAGLDQAVADGVDVISLSVGGHVVALHMDSIAIGGFGAMKKGIFVACSAGNGGPMEFSVTNVAPWLTTVAASTVDRTFPASVHLGNGQAFPGTSLYRFSGHAEEESLHDLVFGADVVRKNVNPPEGAMCMPGALDPVLVKGKIVYCIRGRNRGAQKGEVVKAAGGFGMVLANEALCGETQPADCHLLPATAVDTTAGTMILDYIYTSIKSTNRDTNAPVARFAFGHAGGTQLNVKHSPAVASFSSRGPNPQTLKVLKPDIVAPGVNILAAWTRRQGPTREASDHRQVEFNIDSGTSMSCPHVSGLGALLKGAHPDWSPAAIKSAMMTTASVVDNSNGIITDEETREPADPFRFGSGHVQPERAVSPGLVYDMGAADYVHFLCAMGYTYKQIKIITGEGVYCPVHGKPRVEDMNYPSFSAVYTIGGDRPLSMITFNRTVTNVGYGNSTYTATIESPQEVSVAVHPEILSFSEVNEKKQFTLTVTPTGTTSSVDGVVPANTTSTVFGFIQWSDGRHVVRSPIAVTVLTP